MSTVPTYLSASQLFVRVPRGAVVASTPLWSLRQLADGEVFCHEGEPGDSIAILGAGECSVRVEGVEVGRIKLGELIGETSAFFASGTRSASVVSSGPSTFVVLSADSLRKLRAGRSPLYDPLLQRGLQELARRIQRANDRLTRLVEGTHERPARKDPSALVRLWKSLVPGRPAGPAPSLQPLLRGLPGLGKAPLEALAPLREAFQVRAFSQGEILFLEQDASDSAWLVAEGTVDVLRQVRGTRAERLATLAAGSLFGVNALVGGGARTASCIATSPGWAYRLGSEAHAGLQGDARQWWSECLLAVMQAQLRATTGTLGRAIKGPEAATAAAPAPAEAPAPPATPAPTEPPLDLLLQQSGFLEGLSSDFNLDDIEVVVDDDQLRNPKNRSMPGR